MKKIFFGLGNIGDNYINTRHNIGFIILDSIISFLKIKKKYIRKKYVDVCKIRYNSYLIFFVKPNIGINNSGYSLKYYINNKKIKLKDVLIIVDDIYLPFGKIKIRKNGGHGGHNGLKNICSSLSTNNYNRCRYGIGHNFNKGKQTNYVLSKLNKNELFIIKNNIKILINDIFSFMGIKL